MEEEKKPEKLPVKKVQPAPEMFDIYELGAVLKPWELAGLMHFSRWKPGKRVTPKEFNDNLALFRQRPQGGGRIKK